MMQCNLDTQHKNRHDYYSCVKVSLLLHHIVSQVHDLMLCINPAIVGSVHTHMYIYTAYAAVQLEQPVLHTVAGNTQSMQLGGL